MVYSGCPMFGFGNWSGGWGYMLIGMVIWVLVIVGIIWLILRFINKERFSWGKKPLEILQERYAKGELTKTEFEKMKKELN
ncbi:MAG TPA: SHOCT domain-containing protein [Candidatus Nanoarchaeia archaeon]|nr:SHOCT domain-containing protein [Candidatus Nanoarchaeia archaeon]